MKHKASVPGGLPVTREGKCLNEEPTPQRQMSMCYKGEELTVLIQSPDGKASGGRRSEDIVLSLVNKHQF